MEMVEEHIKGILKNRKIHFTLIDPDEQTPQEALEIAEEAILGGTDGIMIGGSTVNNDEVDEGRFWSRKEIEQNADTNIFTPNFLHEYNHLLKKIK